MRRVIFPALALILLGASCTGSATETTSTTSTTSSTTTSAPPTTESPTTTTSAGPDPLTARPIAADVLELMPLRRGFGTLNGLTANEVRHEDNIVAVSRLPSGNDEAADIQRYERVDGYRTVLRPARLSAEGVLAMDSWVVLFETDEGAAGYLRDFSADMVKGEDAGHGLDLRVVAGDDFVVDEVGSTAIGLILQEESVYGVPGFVETLVGFQVGRLLGFVSVLRNTPDDFRIPTLFAALDLEERMLGVLDGRIRPVVEPEPAVLSSYAFTYSQTLSESYLRVIYPDPVVDEPGEGTPPGENQGSGSGEGSSGEGESTTSSSTSSTTTTTTLLVPTTDITTIDSRGVVLDPGGIDCIVQIGSDFGVERNHVIVVGSRAWRSTLVAGEEIFDEIEPDDEIAATDLIYCPGWSPSMADSGIELVATPGRGEIVEWDDDTTAERFELGLEALVTLGIAPEGGGGLRVDEFVVFLGGEAPWVVGVDLTFRGTTRQMSAALGPGFRERADIVISLRFRLNQINSANLEVVEPPEDAIGQRLEDITR